MSTEVIEEVNELTSVKSLKTWYDIQRTKYWFKVNWINTSEWACDIYFVSKSNEIFVFQNFKTFLKIKSGWSIKIL